MLLVPGNSVRCIKILSVRFKYTGLPPQTSNETLDKSSINVKKAGGVKSNEVKLKSCVFFSICYKIFFFFLN